MRDLATDKERSWGPTPGTLPDDSVVRDIAWTADGQGVFVALSDGTVRLLPLDSSTETRLQDLEMLEYKPSRRADTTALIGQLNDGQIVMWGAVVIEDSSTVFVDLYDPVTGATIQIATSSGDDPVFASVDKAGTTVLLRVGNHVWSIGEVEIDFTFDGYVSGVGG